MKYHERQLLISFSLQKERTATHQMANTDIDNPERMMHIVNPLVDIVFLVSISAGNETVLNVVPIAVSVIERTCNVEDRVSTSCRHTIFYVAGSLNGTHSSTTAELRSLSVVPKTKERRTEGRRNIRN